MLLSRSPQLRVWVDALAQYALGKEDQGTVEGWAKKGW